MFQFKQFVIHQDRCAMKVTETACIQGAWASVSNHVKRVLDIGSGTGLLSLMLAQRYPAIEIHAVELDEAGFQQGQDNIAASKFATRIHAWHGDIREFQTETQFDFIISNPPFFEQQLKSPNPNKNLAWHSDQLNLSELLHAISELVAPHGKACILYPWSRWDQFNHECTEQGLWVERVLVIQHSAQHPKSHFIAMVGKDKTSELFSETLIVKQDQQYTTAMQQLMRDFYLKL